MEKLPLEGYRVVNLGWQWAAPVFGEILADCGAEVIRVESHNSFDYFRRMVLLASKDMGGSWNIWNQGVLAITANLKEPRGVELIKRLVAKSDILVENYPPRVMSGLGFTYEEIKEVKSDIIMISMAGAGQDGPLKDIQLYGPLLGGFSGLHSTLGYESGEPSFEIAYTDPTASVVGIFHVLAALRHRNKTGEGQYIDMSQVEASIALFSEGVMEYTMNNRVLNFFENRCRGMAPHNNYPCKGEDRWVSIAVKTEDEWNNLCKAMGNPAWTKEDRFADSYQRLNNRKELDELISEWTLKYTNYEVMMNLQNNGVAAAVLMDVEQQLWDPHHQARNTYEFIQHVSQDGSEPYVHPIYTTPWRFSDFENSKCSKRAPFVGEHNQYIYGEILGLSSNEIRKLEEEKVIY